LNHCYFFDLIHNQTEQTSQTKTGLHDKSKKKGDVSSGLFPTKGKRKKERKEKEKKGREKEKGKRKKEKGKKGKEKEKGEREKGKGKRKKRKRGKDIRKTTNPIMTPIVTTINWVNNGNTLLRSQYLPL